MPTPTIEMVSDQNTRCGEGPLWDEVNGRILWVDNESDLVFEYRLSDQKTFTLCRTVRASRLALDHDGHLTLIGPRGVHLLGQDGQVTAILENPESGDYCFNDSVVGLNTLERIGETTPPWGDPESG